MAINALALSNILIGYLFDTWLLICKEDLRFLFSNTCTVISDEFWLPKISGRKYLPWLSGPEFFSEFAPISSFLYGQDILPRQSSMYPIWFCWPFFDRSTCSKRSKESLRCHVWTSSDMFRNFFEWQELIWLHHFGHMSIPELWEFSECFERQNIKAPNLSIFSTE